MGLASIARAVAAGADRSLARALRLRVAAARYARLTAIGDPGGSPELVAESVAAAHAIVAAGLRVIGYTHGWQSPDAAPLRAVGFRASVDSLESADAAIAAGWRVAIALPAGVAVPHRTPGGARVVGCPAQTRPGVVTCNDRCGLCADSPVAIAFIAHGNQAADVGASPAPEPVPFRGGRLAWVPAANNVKTGPIPTAYVV